MRSISSSSSSMHSGGPAPSRRWGPPRLPISSLPSLRSPLCAGSGTIDKAELGAVIKALGHHATPVELDALMERLDADNSGTIDFEEFVAGGLPGL